MEARTARLLQEAEATAKSLLAHVAQIRQADERLAAAGMSTIDIERVCAEEGLRHLGGRYGKAGEFWGIDGHARVIAVGRRDVMINVFFIGIYRDDQLTRPDTRWIMYRTQLQSRMTEDTLRQWAAWVKRGYTTADLRKLAREQYERATPETDGRKYVSVSGSMKRPGAA